MVYPSWFDLVVSLVLYSLLSGSSETVYMVMPAPVGTVRYLAYLVILRKIYLMAKNGFVYQVLFIAILVMFLVLSTVRD